jgi:two-component system CheB/CheR fusion protein
VPERETRTALATGRAADDRFHLRKDGSRFWASGVLMSMRDTAGAAIGFVKILRDQTEARRTQEALERSQAQLLKASRESERARREAELQKEHLAALFTEAPAPICILRGADYIVEFANDHMCQLRRPPAWRRRRQAPVRGGAGHAGAGAGRICSTA